ncbi:MAG TPA: Fic family protein [Thermoanaerobaculia bacterium]
MPVAWNEDDPRDEAVLVRNLGQVLRELVQGSPLRQVPSVAMAQEWHRKIYEGIRLPVAYFAGEIRDSDPRFPELDGYEVQVGRHLGMPSSQVPSELANYEAALREAVAVLDAEIPVGRYPDGPDQLLSLLTLLAYAHGEWVRIHPFANGNGRTARLWANWCALRYSLPAFVRLKPRPEGSLYANAAAASMDGDHQRMIAVFAEMLDQYLTLRPRRSAS